MNTYVGQIGDVFLNDSDKMGAKVVKFLQTAPTLWHYIYRAIRGTQEPVRYYHAGMVLDDKTLIEQQWNVKKDELSKILTRVVIIYRYKNIGSVKDKVYQRAIEDIGKTYDIPQLIGKTLTLLTGIKGFVRLLGAWSKENEICVTRVGDWYEGICNFGVKTKHEITTKIIDEYCVYSEEWEIVYKN